MTEFERRIHNNRILDSWKNGESLTVIKAQSTWFPPRPIIKKDKRALDVVMKPKKTILKFKGKTL